MDRLQLLKNGTLILLSYLFVENSMKIKDKEQYSTLDYLFLYGTSFGLFVCIRLWIHEMFRPREILRTHTKKTKVFCIGSLG